ncbi:hypothetical protein IEQ34_017688 [Dendrobium chrysotoxum]|uniref:Uncharacterized protein n=1 Tax=Dendrobium chrysotoxum TaxID=161865 RepID=A0AAV7GCA0_DENCH|nr:hypothetical protein IEQ34_017688 [Dendrobium chrysotoxum]
MASFLHQPPLIHHRNQITIPDRTQPVRHHHTRPPNHNSLQRLLHHFLRLAIQGARRLVQQQYLRIPQYRPRYRYSLLLPAGQLNPSLPAPRVVPILQPAYKIMRVCRSRRRLRFARHRFFQPVCYILPHRAGE